MVFKNKLFVRLLVTYLVILMLALITLFASQSLFSNALTEKVAETAMSMIEVGAKTVDNEFMRLDDLAHNILESTTIKKLNRIGNPISKTDYYTMLECSSELSTLLLYSGQIDVQSAVYIPVSRILMHSDILTARGESLYNSYMKYDAHEWESFCKRVENQTHYSETWASENAMFKNNIEKVITFAYKSPSAYSMSQSPAVLFIVPEQSLLDRFGYIMQSDRGMYAITDARGNIITSSKMICEENEKIFHNAVEGSSFISMDGENWLTVSKTSESTNYRYIALIPENEINSRTDEITSKIALILVGAFAIAVVLSLIFTGRFTRPVIRLAKAVEGGVPNTEKSTSAYSFIEEPVNQLIVDKAGLQTVLLEQQIRLRNDLLEGLLANHFVNEEDVERRIKLTDVKFDKAFMCVMSVILRRHTIDDSFETLEEEHQEMSRILKKIGEAAGEDYYIVQHGDHEISVIILFNTNKEKDVIIAGIIQHIDDEKLSIGTGRNCTHPFELYRSLNDAHKAIRNRGEEGKKEQKFATDPECDMACIYPLSTEERIITMISAGETQAVESMLGEIRLQLDSVQNDLLYTEICSCLRITAKRAIDNMPAMEESIRQQVIETIGNNPGTLSPQRVYARSEQTIIMLADYAKEMKNNTAKKELQDIVDYIDREYCDMNMCLSFAAEHFQLSEKHLSRLFKEYTGENFSTYIEKKRMIRAKEYLKDNTMTIAQIASALGYSSENTFYKAFKRYYGMTPREM